MRRRRASRAVRAAQRSAPPAAARLAALLLLAWAGLACGRAAAATPGDVAAGDRAAGVRALADDTGVVVGVPARPRRIACLAPDLTEIAFALGAGPRVVGACDPCDYPEAAAKLARLGPMVEPSIEAIVLLRPDLVLATAEGNPLHVVQRLRELGVPVFGVKPQPGIAGVAALLRRLGDLVGEPAAGDAMARDVETRVAAVRERSAARARVRGCVLVWTDPPIAAGRDAYLTELADAAGVDNACATGDGWPRLSREDVLLARPELLLLGTGTPEARLGPWADTLPAVRRRAVLVLPERPFLRPTAELGAAAESLERDVAALPRSSAP